MKSDFPILKSVSLFKGFHPDDLKSMLSCLNAVTKTYMKDEFIFSAGQSLEYVGILLEGQAQIIREDMDGNRFIIAVLSPGELFGEALCCARTAESPVSVLTSSDCSVMLLPFFRIINTCSNACVFHTRLIENMMYLLAEKNLHLQKRMDIVSSHSLRDKLLKYFEPFIKKRGESFTIPLNREEMAEYLCADRSALSHELMKMKAEGLIQYQKNSFTVL